MVVVAILRSFHVSEIERSNGLAIFIEHFGDIHRVFIQDDEYLPPVPKRHLVIGIEIGNIARRWIQIRQLNDSKDEIRLYGVFLHVSRLNPAMAFNVKTVSDTEADAALNTLAARFTRNMVCDPRNVQPEEGGAGLYVRTGANWFGDVVDPRPQMRRFPGNVLVLQGQCAFMPYAEAYEYVDLFPNARYRFVAGAGHILWWEQPEAYAQAIKAFLAEDARAP